MKQGRKSRSTTVRAVACALMAVLAFAAVAPAVIPASAFAQAAGDEYANGGLPSGGNGDASNAAPPATSSDDSGGGVQVLLIGGEPINEPIVRRGPFVLNTAAQLQEAFDDYRAGRMGSIEGAAERRAQA